MAVDKREAKREFKERKVEKGVLAVRCAASGETWVSATANLASARTGMLFMLRNHMHHNKAMQAAWDAHGEGSFEFDVVELFDEDLAPMLLADALRNRRKHWERELSARMV